MTARAQNIEKILSENFIMCALRIFEIKIVLCKKGDEITRLDVPKYFA